MEVYGLEEKKAIDELWHFDCAYNREIKIVLNLIEKQSKEIEEYKKQLDLDNECEIALNSKVMDLEKEIEELKEDNKHQWEERCKLTFELENSTSNDKIKAKIEELEKQDKESKLSHNYLVIPVLQSLLKKE